MTIKRSTSWAPLLALAAAAALAGCSGAASPSTAPGSIPAPSIATSPSAPPTPDATEVPASPTAEGPTSPDPIPEGEYATADITEEMILSALDRADIDDPELTRTAVEVIAFRDSVIFSFRLMDGKLELFQSVDGGVTELGWAGTYAFLDEGTMVAEEGATGCGYTYGLTVRSDEFHIDVVRACEGDPVDLAVQTAFFESAPFTLRP